MYLFGVLLSFLNPASPVAGLKLSPWGPALPVKPGPTHGRCTVLENQLPGFTVSELCSSLTKLQDHPWPPVVLGSVIGVNSGWDHSVPGFWLCIRMAYRPIKFRPGRCGLRELPLRAQARQTAWEQWWVLILCMWNVWVVLALRSYPGSTVWSNIMSEKVIKSFYSESEWINRVHQKVRGEVDWRIVSGGQLIRRQEVTQTGCMNQEALIQGKRREWVVRGQRATLAALPKGSLLHQERCSHSSFSAAGLGKWLLISHVNSGIWWGVLQGCDEPWYRPRKSCTWDILERR